MVWLQKQEYSEKNKDKINEYSRVKFFASHRDAGEAARHGGRIRCRGERDGVRPSLKLRTACCGRGAPTRKEAWEKDIASSARTSVTRRELILFREHILLTWYTKLRQALTH